MLTIIFCLIAGSFLYHFFTKKRTEDGCEKTISRKDWQYRLIAWTIRAEPDFKGYCPYFWSFWLCLFLIPFTLASKVLEFVFSLWGGREPEENEELIATPSNYLQEAAYNEGDGEDQYYTKSLNRQYPEWVASNPNWREAVGIRLEAEKKREVLEEQKDAARQKRKEFLQAKLAIAVEYTRWMVKPLIISASLLVAWGLFKLVMSISSVVASTDFLWSLLIVAGILGSISLVNYILKWIKSVAKVVEKISPVETKSTVGSDFMTKFWDIVTFPFKLVGRAYQKECPLIKYKED